MEFVLHLTRRHPRGLKITIKDGDFNATHHRTYAGGALYYHCVYYRVCIAADVLQYYVVDCVKQKEKKKKKKY